MQLHYSVVWMHSTVEQSHISSASSYLLDLYITLTRNKSYLQYTLDFVLAIERQLRAHTNHFHYAHRFLCVC
jgi:hypothetical protein